MLHLVFSFCKSILSPWLTCLSILCWSPTCPYGSLAPSPILRISLMILICGIASHCSRRIRRRSCRLDAMYSLPQLIPFHTRYLPGMQVISDDPGSMRANIKSRQMSLNQTMKLWNLGNEMKMKWWCFRPLLCTLFRLNWAKQTPGIMRRN